MLKKKIIEFNETAKKNNLYLFSLIAFAALILLLSVVPEFGGGINVGVNAHVPAYIVLSLTASLYFRAKGSEHPLLNGVLLAGFYGVFVEFVQYFIPYRQFGLQDIIINFSAALTAVIPNFFLIRQKCI